jgi:hypothetical protein
LLCLLLPGGTRTSVDREQALFITTPKVYSVTRPSFVEIILESTLLHYRSFTDVYGKTWFVVVQMGDLSLLSIKSDVQKAYANAYTDCILCWVAFSTLKYPD